jgi:hypothetical protein
VRFLCNCDSQGCSEPIASRNMPDFAVELLAPCSFERTGPTDGRIEGGVGISVGGGGGAAAGQGFPRPWTVQILRQPAGQLSCPCDSECPRVPRWPRCPRDAVSSCRPSGAEVAFVGRSRSKTDSHDWHALRLLHRARELGADDSLQDSGSVINEELPTLNGVSSHPLLPLGR